MNRDAWSRNLYMLNFSLLFTHEIDSAYWQEWKMFGIPGGIQFFLLLHIVLLLAALWGLRRLLEGLRSGYVLALVLAAAGVFAFCIHTYFILVGRQEFRLPVSLILLGSILIVSAAQGLLAVRSLRTA